ncbi:conserved exported hypothetical protein [uncultured Eubacteriales bacterium]|uniref:Uncharacterized protein n=1 Tax=uncultured Eubacteriales bacterium TaxID=172733 RepID=A0A212JQD7_9FIRM|nr:conserved exported hypothetical protein [uncultured Eubacteriales bacterium]
MDTIIVAAISFLGTLAGAGMGVIASARLTNWRIEQLEKKVEKHNSVVERTYLLEEQMKEANHRITDLEENKM